MIMVVTQLKHSKTIVILASLAIVVLVAATAYSLQTQARLSTETKVFEAGLIESADRPTLYFILKNVGTSLLNYTYSVTYNSTDGIKSYVDAVAIAPNQDFKYSISLVRPTNGVAMLSVSIYQGWHVKGGAQVHNQTWAIRSLTP